LITTMTTNCIGPQRPIQNGSLYTYVKNTGVYSCPDDSQGNNKTVSYSMNSSVSGDSLAAFESPSSCVLMIDEGDFTKSGYASNLNDGNFQAPTTSGGTPDTTDVFNFDRPTAIHSGGANFAYGDGHVKWHRVEQMKVTDFDPTYSD
jgi:prepilin-type processing-associated H-X9-DG protein